MVWVGTESAAPSKEKEKGGCTKNTRPRQIFNGGTSYLGPFQGAQNEWELKKAYGGGGGGRIGDGEAAQSNPPAEKVGSGVPKGGGGFRKLKVSQNRSRGDVYGTVCASEDKNHRQTKQGKFRK